MTGARPRVEPQVAQPGVQMEMELLRPILNALAQETARLILAALQTGNARPSQSLWVDTKTAAVYLKLTVTALRQRRSSGKIPENCYTANLGRDLRWNLDAIDRWLETEQVDSEGS